MAENRVIQIEVPTEQKADWYELRIYSGRNEPVVKESDASPRDPGRESRLYGTKYEGMYNFNYLFPVVDFEYDGTMEGVLLFEDVFYGTWAMNPMYHREQRFPLSSKVVVPGCYLEWWENMFHYDNPQARVTEFYMRKRYPTETEMIKEEIRLLSDQWMGRVAVWEVVDGSERLLWEENFDFDSVRQTEPGNRIGMDSKSEVPVRLSREILLTALDADLDFIMKSRNRNPYSAVPGGTFLFYDYDARTFRQRNWLWTFGPTMQTLLKARDIPEMSEKYGSDRLLETAVLMGDLCVNNQELNPQKPNYGLLLCRLDHDTVNNRLGYELKYSPPDGLFQAGWGMMPLYRATGDKRYLEFCRIMADATGRLVNQDVIIQQDYFAVTESWKTNTMDEAGFGMEGIAELYLDTGDPRVAEIGRKYIDQLIRYFEMPDGTWARNYFRHSRTVEPPFDLTRGAGWAMMGISSAARMGLGEEYLEKCRRMASVLMKHQNEDGSWWYRFSEADPVNGIAEKGTAVWTVMFYRLYKMMGNTQYLETARKGLIWLINSQYKGTDRDGRGGVPVSGPMSGVSYRPFFRMACQYTAGFLGLALMEELSLESRDNEKKG